MTLPARRIHHSIRPFLLQSGAKEVMGLDRCVLSSLTGLVNLLRQDGVIPTIVLEMKSHGIGFHTA